MNERLLKDTLTIDFSIELDEVIERLFWKDQYLYEDNMLYIKDTYHSKWYSIERKYQYAGGRYIVKEGIKAKFYLIEDEEVEKELEAFFYE